MAPRTKAPAPAVAAAEVAAARGPQPASPVDQLRAAQARAQQEAAAERPVARTEARASVLPLMEGRVTALNRQGLPVQRTSAGSGIDQFHIPSGLVPPGWTWAWKNETVLGQPNEAYMGSLIANGWEPVRAETYPGKLAPEFLPNGDPYKGPIRRHGMILMEQPEELTLEARKEEKAKANAAVQNAIRKHTRGLERPADVSAGNVETQLTGRAAPMASKSIEAGIPSPRVYERQPVE